MTTQQKHVVYCPPSWETIQRYAREVGQALARSGDPTFADPEVSRGLANFIQVIASIRAKQLNGELGKVDKDGE